MTTKKKKTSVTFAGDDEVVQHIMPLNERRNMVKVDKWTPAGLRSAPSCLKKPKQKPSVTEDENDGDSDDAVFRPSEVLTSERDVGGTEVYGFRTPKKSGQMSQKAAEEAQKSRTPKTPSTPKSSLRRRVLIEQQEVLTPRRSQRHKKETLRKMAAYTPNRMRRRNKADYNESSSEDSGESDSDSDASETGTTASDTESQNEDHISSDPSTPSRGKSTPESTPSTPQRKSSQQSIGNTPRRRHHARDDLQVATNVESYFDIHHSSTVTSDRTLTRLGPRMDQHTLTDTLSGLTGPYQVERAELYAEHRAMFRKWMFTLCNGFNLLFHGLGSKRHLMEEFRTTTLSQFNHLVVNGFFPSLTIKSILSAITEDILDHRGSFKTPMEQCNFIKKHYEAGDYEELYLIIHNIDGPMLRPEKTQNVLSHLAQTTGVHILASIDHINAPLIWDQTKASRFNWLWYDVTTFDPYVEETSYENSLLVQQSGALALSSLQHVMNSLTPNARRIFLLLVQHQLDHSDCSAYSGLAFPDLYQKCREEFLVNSDLTLRTQLTEFKDHKLIRTKKGLDGVEYLVIPLDDGTLKEFLEQQQATES